MTKEIISLDGRTFVKKEDEFCLSDEIDPYDDQIIFVSKVKEFIKRDWELVKLLECKQITLTEFVRRREKLAGDKLNGN
jgi:hypothetical protein